MRTDRFSSSSSLPEAVLPPAGSVRKPLGWGAAHWSPRLRRDRGVSALAKPDRDSAPAAGSLPRWLRARKALVLPPSVRPASVESDGGNPLAPPGQSSPAQSRSPRRSLARSFPVKANLERNPFPSKRRRRLRSARSRQTQSSGPPQRGCASPMRTRHSSCDRLGFRSSVLSEQNMGLPSTLPTKPGRWLVQSPAHLVQNQRLSAHPIP